jgi:HTH-type transcriptional regulator / antitoxin HipB
MLNLNMNGLNSCLSWLLLHLKRIKNMNLASLVRFHRKAAELSQIELAALANVSRKVVQCIESGGDQVSWKNVQAVLAVLNVTLTPTGPLVMQWRTGVEHKDPKA